MNEPYITDILMALPDGLTCAGFLDRCRADINASWQDEVDEAWKRYRDAGRASVRRKPVETRR